MEFPDGEVLIVYYHAITEANRLQAIYGVRKLAEEDTFSEPFLVSKDKPTKMEGNPVTLDSPRYWQTLVILCRILWRVVCL